MVSGSVLDLNRPKAFLFSPKKIVLFFFFVFFRFFSLTWLCLEEFVAHASNVNCLKIGRRTSRVLVTGGEDHKVNLWAIGKPNAILVSSLS